MAIGEGHPGIVPLSLGGKKMQPRIWCEGIIHDFAALPCQLPRFTTWTHPCVFKGGLAIYPV